MKEKKSFKDEEFNARRVNKDYIPDDEDRKHRGQTSSRYFLFYYREWCRRARKKAMKDDKAIMKIRTLLMETIEEHYLNNEGGVYLENIGYLCHMVVPNRKLLSYTGVGTKFLTRKKMNGFYYKHLCIPIEKKGTKYYNLDLSWLLVKKCKELMEKGVRYRFLYREVIDRTHRVKPWSLIRIWEPKFTKYVYYRMVGGKRLFRKQKE